MNKTVYENVREKIEKEIEKRELQRNALEAGIMNKNEVIAAAKERMIEATTADDMKAYKAAKEELDDAMYSLSFFSDRAVLLEKEAYISDDECQEIIEKIHGEQERITKEAVEEITPLLFRIFSIAENCLERVDEGNALLVQWHTNVKRFEKTFGYRNGEPMKREEVPYYTGAQNLGMFVEDIKKSGFVVELLKCKEASDKETEE